MVHEAVEREHFESHIKRQANYLGESIELDESKIIRASGKIIDLRGRITVPYSYLCLSEVGELKLLWRAQSTANEREYHYLKHPESPLDRGRIKRRWVLHQPEPDGEYNLYAYLNFESLMGLKEQLTEDGKAGREFQDVFRYAICTFCDHIVEDLQSK